MGKLMPHSLLWALILNVAVLCWPSLIHVDFFFLFLSLFPDGLIVYVTKANYLTKIKVICFALVLHSEVEKMIHFSLDS